MDPIERALEILGLGPDANPEDIKQAYRDLVKVWHPDRFPNGSRVRRKAEEKLKEINQGYEILQGYDPASRVRPRPHGGPSVRPNPAQDHERTQAPKQDSSSPPFEPSGKKEAATPAPASRRLPRYAYVVIGAILAICLIGYLMHPPSQEEWKKRAIALEEMKDWKGMLDWSRKWTKSEPNNVDAWFNLGISYGELNRDNDAIEANRQALRINPEHVKAWNNLGVDYLHLKRNDNAIEAFRQALRINPEYVPTKFNLGLAYSISGNQSAAREALRELRRLDPEQANKLFNLIVPR